MPGFGSTTESELFGPWGLDGFGSTAFVTQMVKLLVQSRGTVAATASACTGGGTVASSTDPTPGTSLATATTPVAYMTLTTDGGTEYYSSLPLSTDRYYTPRVTRWGRIRRSLSDWFGGFDVATFSVELSDTDRRLRTLANSGTLLKKRVQVFVGDLAVLKAGGTARRVFNGVVTRYKPLPELKFQLECEDSLGSILSQFFAGTKLVPLRTFTTDDFPHMGNPPDHPTSPGNPDMLGRAVPLCYGSLSDESAGSDAIGVVQPIFTGLRNFSGADWHEFVICQGSIARVQSGFNPVGPGLTVGTSTAARVKLTDDEADFLFPGGTWYQTYVDSNMYRDFNSNRYSVIYGRGPRAVLARKMTVPYTLNICGYETVGDGTGSMISSLALQIQHFLTNFVLTQYASGNWAAIPTTSGYSIIKSSSFTGSKTKSEARISGGYLGAWQLAHDGRQVNLHELIADLCRCADIDLGVNWDGQLIGSMVDSSASAVAAWTDALTVIQNQFDLDRQFDLAANRIVYNFAKRYIDPLTNATPEEEFPLPRKNPLGSEDWYENDEVSDSGSITAIDEKKYDVDYGAIRDSATAADAAAQRLARSAQHDEGPLFATIQTNLVGQDVELGDNVSLTHFGGLGASGYSVKSVRVRAQELDLNDMTIDHTVQDLAA